MKLIFFRHAKALDRDIAVKKKISDADRPLTREGIAEFTKLVKFLAHRIGKIDLLLTSPFLRAKETAKIVQKKIKVKELVVDDVIAHGNSGEDMAELIKRQKQKVVGVVGHEPELSSVISQILGSKNVLIDFKKGAICILEGEHGDFVMTALWSPRDILKVPG